MTLSPYLAEQLSNWASEFPETEAARPFPPEALAEAPGVLAALLTGACERAGGELERVGPAELAGALDALAFPEAFGRNAGGILAAFLAQLEASGRLADGADLGRRLAVAAGAKADPATGKSRPPLRAGAKISRNDPCPCGSGKKYKKCCLGAGG